MIRQALVARAVVCATLLAALTIPWWTDVADDIYITIGYAADWANGSGLHHPNGDGSEGFSNWLWLCCAAVATVTGVDAIVALQLLSLLTGISFVAWIAVAAPVGWRGTVAAASVASLTSLAAWSGDAMEAVAHGLLLAGGWVLVQTSERWRVAGVWMMALAAISRPEAHLHLLVAAVFLGTRHPLRQLAQQAWGPVLLLSAFHVGRLWWFGDLVPNPVVAKSSMGPTWQGCSQAAVDVLLTAPAVVTVLSLFRVARWRAALLPLAIQGGVAAVGPIDWMGAGRLVLPGAMATIALLVTYADREHVRSGVGSLALMMASWVGVLLESGVVPGDDRVTVSLRPLPGADAGQVVLRGIETPFIRDVVFLAGEVPPGLHVYTGDAGLPGLVPDVRLWDTAGLIDRTVAEHRASGGVVSDVLAARVDGSADSAVCYKQRALGPPNLISEEIPGYRVRLAVMEGGVTSAWLCREVPYAESRRAAVRRRRLKRLAAQFRGHPELRYEFARALASAGDLEGARAVVRDGRRDLPTSPVWSRGETGLLFARHDDRGQWSESGELTLTFNGTLTTRPLEASDVATAALVLTAESHHGAPAVIRMQAGDCPSGTRTVLGDQVLVLPLADVDCAVTGATVRVSLVNDGLVGADDVNLVVAVVDRS